MAVTIRLSKTGRRNAPYYRVVVADQRRKRDGRIIENVGSYDPRKPKGSATFERERITYWMSKGAKPTLTVSRLLKHSAKASAAAAK
jgi:small subunit ribosomal protein S16